MYLLLFPPERVMAKHRNVKAEKGSQSIQTPSCDLSTEPCAGTHRKPSSDEFPTFLTLRPSLTSLRSLSLSPSQQYLLRLEVAACVKQEWNVNCGEH